MYVSGPLVVPRARQEQDLSLVLKAWKGKYRSEPEFYGQFCSISAEQKEGKPTPKKAGRALFLFMVV